MLHTTYQKYFYHVLLLLDQGSAAAGISGIPDNCEFICIYSAHTLMPLFVSVSDYFEFIVQLCIYVCVYRMYMLCACVYVEKGT